MFKMDLYLYIFFLSFVSSFINLLFPLLVDNNQVDITKIKAMLQAYGHETSYIC